MESERAEKIKAASIRYEHFPKQGVTFIDIFPIISEPKVFSMVLDAFEERLKGVEFNKMFMLESKGFLFGPALSVRVNKPCYPIRKKGKLPGVCEELAYALEYGNDVIEVQRHLLQPGDKVVLIDDVLATGGTLNAAIKLVQKLGGQVAAILLLSQVSALNGKSNLSIPAERVFSIYLD